MRNTRRKGGILITVLINLLINFDTSVIAWLLLAAHFIFDISIVWFIVAISVWAVAVISRTLFIRFAVRSGNEPAPYRKNKNPYSKKNSDVFKQE